MTANPPVRASYPGPVSEAMITELRQYVVTDPQPFALDLAKCHGMTLVTVDGQELFDWAGYYGSKLIGHNHPGLYEPDYVQRLTLAANNKVANPDFLTRECLDFYRMLHRCAPECMRGPNLEVYAVNSGAEAVENMMKYMVSKFNAKRLAQGKLVANRRFVYFDKAFHGRTVFALGVTQTIDTVATKDFQGLANSANIKVPFPSIGSGDKESARLAKTESALRMIESVVEQMADEIVGIIVEPIQGAGGQRVALPQFFRGLSELAHQYDVYLGFDEVQTGCGPTGKMFAIDHFDLPHPPLAVASGKKFGSGVLFMREPLDDMGILDSTWGGTLADMVRVVQEMAIVEREGLIERAAVNGDLLHRGLLALADKHPTWIQHVRGMGLYQGFSTGSPERKSAMISAARDRFDLLLLGAGTMSIRTRPNLSVTAEDVDRFLSLLDACVTDLGS